MPAFKTPLKVLFDPTDMFATQLDIKAEHIRDVKNAVAPDGSVEAVIVYAKSPREKMEPMLIIQ
ncbi:MAG: hypothetical protein M4579_007360, partial [Chaenotheca gracillima]